MTLVFILLIVLPLVGLAVINFHNDGFGYPEVEADTVPVHEREKHERLATPAGKVF